MQKDTPPAVSTISPRGPTRRAPLNLGLMTGIVATVGAVLFPVLWQDSYALHVGITSLIVVCYAVSFDLFVGLTGYLSLAHVGFIGAGAYGTAVLNQRGVPTAWAMAISALGVLVIAGLVGAPILRRTSGFIFTIVSLGIVVLIYVTINAWIPVTRGPFGIHGIEAPVVLGFEFTSNEWFYYGALVLALAFNGVYLLWNSGQRRRRLEAIRENERLAESCGLNTFPAKWQTFMIAGIMGAVIGGFHAAYLTVVTPEIAWIRWIILVLVIVVVAGPGNLLAVNIAAVFFVVAPEALRIGEDRRELLAAAVMLATILIAPGGWGPLVRQTLGRRRESTQR